MAENKLEILIMTKMDSLKMAALMTFYAIA